VRRIQKYKDFILESFKETSKKLDKLQKKLDGLTLKDPEYGRTKKEVEKLETGITKKYNLGNQYAVGDLVMIRYHQTGDLTPVKIEKIESKNRYYVSHNVEGSLFRNAPDQSINVGDIVGMYKSNSAPATGSDASDREVTAISNDIVINNYPFNY